MLTLAEESVRQYNNIEEVFLIATTLNAAGTFTTPAFTNFNASGLKLFLTINGAVTGTTPTLDVKLQEKDPNSTLWVDMPSASFAQKNAANANSSDSLTIYPGITETANRKVSNFVPRTFRFSYTVGGTTPVFTNVSISGSYLL